MYIRKDTLNTRGYAESFKIAKIALKTIEKIKQCAEHSITHYGDEHINRPDLEYNFFDITQLRMICFDYAFAAIENFLEHIGYILFSDWDSNIKQRHYNEKRNKLLLIHEAIEKKHQPDLDYKILESKWCSIIQSINMGSYTNKRNPIKHIHAEKHDVKIQTVLTNSTIMDAGEYEQLISDTSLALTDIECGEIIKEIENFINSLHIYLQQNKLIFKIYCENRQDQQLEKRKQLLQIFLVNPFAPPIYASGLTGRSFTKA